MPTETVYGLAARADDPQAVGRIYKAKNRPSINPLILHVSSIDQAKRYAFITREAKAIAHQFWPGPLTLVLPLHDNAQLAPQVTAGLKTIAIRCPAHQTALKILNKLSFPLVAPSANRSGTVSPTRAIDVAHSLGDEVDMIIADKNITVGLESTILDLSVSPPVILRQGAISADDLSPLLGEVSLSEHNPEKPKAPGQMFRHYAPRTPLRLNAVDVAPDEALLAFGATRFMGIKGGGKASDLPEDSLRNLSESGDLEEAARNLYAMMHDLDRPGKSAIAVMPIPEKGIGLAINERLSRAASGNES